VGAVLVREDQVLGEGFNQPITGHDPTAHAEVVALRAAADAEQNYRLPGSTLYVTLEPCTMCFGAMVHARIGRLVYGATEPRAGVCESQLQLPSVDFYNHRVEVEKGVLAEESAMLLKRFFADRRKRPR
jgi:tRNA(adenine34) deaminase